MNEDLRNFSILQEIDLNSIPHFEENNHNISHHSFDLNSNPPNEDESDIQESEDEFENQEREDEFENQENEDLRLLLGASSGMSLFTFFFLKFFLNPSSLLGLSFKSFFSFFLLPLVSV